MPPLQNVILFATQNSARVVQYIWRKKKKTSSLQPTLGTNSAYFRIWPNDWELHIKYSVCNTSEDKMNSQLCWLITRRGLTFIPSPWNGAKRQKNPLGAPTDLPAHSLLTHVPEHGWGSMERSHEGKQQKLHFSMLLLPLSNKSFINKRQKLYIQSITSPSVTLLPSLL